jgi:hypothetical protein
MEFYSTDVGGLSLKVHKTDVGWEASIAGPASLMNLETAQRAAENMAEAMLGREVSSSMNWYGLQGWSATRVAGSAMKRSRRKQRKYGVP